MRVLATPQGDRTVRSLEDPTTPITGDQLVNYLGLDSVSFTGRSVTPIGALTGTAAVYACVRLLAAGGYLPVHLFRKAGKETQQVPQGLDRFPGRLARALHQAPNPEMPAGQVWSTAIAHGCLWGNAYFNVVRDGGRPVELWPLRPDLTDPKRDRDTGRKFYRTVIPDSGRELDLLPSEVLHIPDLVVDGMKGLSPITVARNAVAIEQAAAEHGGRFFQNSAVPGLVVKVPGGIENKPEKAKLIREQWQEFHGGLKRKHRVAVLGAGWDVETLAMNHEDAQFMETRRFQITEVARIFGIPPHMIGDVERSTSCGPGIEQQGIGFVTYASGPRLVAMEQSMNLGLGFPQDVPGESWRTLGDEGYFVKFNVSGLLRGDSKTRAEFYDAMVRLRVMNPAQVAELEDLPYDPERPTEYENPNTTAGDQMTGAVRSLIRGEMAPSSNGHEVLVP